MTWLDVLVSYLDYNYFHSYLNGDHKNAHTNVQRRQKCARNLRYFWTTRNNDIQVNLALFSVNGLTTPG